MWSGPRNLSTAMMYSFAARDDCAVWDEPFYAAYLSASGAEHPMREQVLQQHEADVERIVSGCLGPVPKGKPLFYMKHMPHHMMPNFPLDWAVGCVNVHLIRHPARVIASYLQKRCDVTMEDIGFEAQLRIFRALGGPVIDSADIRQAPGQLLPRLCSRIGIAYTDAMLSWPQGGRSEDGVWAAHWYGAVHASTGFAGPEGPLPEVPKRYSALLERALAAYNVMAQNKLSLTDEEL